MSLSGEGERSSSAALEPGRIPAALIVIDVQKGFDEIEAEGLRRNNHGALGKIVELLARFRSQGAPVIHIRHASTTPGSKFAPDVPGFAVKEEAAERPGESVILKHANSAFIGTDLEQQLRAAGIQRVVIVGATTNHCVETTARMAGNLGFATELVRDATWTFDRVGPDGDRHSAEAIHAMTLANLHEEFARIVYADDVVPRVDP